MPQENAVIEFPSKTAAALEELEESYRTAMQALAGMGKTIASLDVDWHGTEDEDAVDARIGRLVANMRRNIDRRSQRVCDDLQTLLETDGDA